MSVLEYLFKQATKNIDPTGAGYTLHQLRHSRLTHLGEEGWSSSMLMALSGHRNLRSLGSYVQLSTEAVAAAPAEHDPGRRTRGPLFVRIDQHGNLGAAMRRGDRAISDPEERLSVRAVDDIVAGAAERAGLDADRMEGLRRQFSAPRRGYASAARAAGVPLTIARCGGWRPNSLVLWDCFEQVSIGGRPRRRTTCCEGDH